jgi:hypothetical protein
MIKPSVIVILLAVCALLGIGILLVQGDRPIPTQTIKEGTPLIPDFKPADVNSVHIKKADTEIKMEKKDGNWVLTSHKNRPAKVDRIDALLNNVRDAKLQGQRTGGDATFNLDAESRIELTMDGASGKTQLFLGKSPEWGKCFVRTTDSGPALETDKPLDTDASARTEGSGRVIDVQHFYDLRIVAVSQDDVNEIVIARNNGKEVQTFKLQKVEPDQKAIDEAKKAAEAEPEPEPEPASPHGHAGSKAKKDTTPKPVWWIVEPKKALADEAAVNSILSNLSNLNAKSYAEGLKPEDSGLMNPVAKATLVTKEGKQYAISFGKQEGDEVVLQIAGKNDLFKAYKYVLENLQKDLEKKEEAEKEGPAVAPLVPPAEPEKKPAPKAETKPPEDKKPEATIPAIPNKVEPKPDTTLPPAVVKPEQKKIDDKK